MMMQEDINMSTMQKDLISGNFIENVNKQIIKRNLGLVNTLFNLVIVYILIAILEWYLLISKLNLTDFSPKIIYYYFVDPFLVFTLMAISVVSYTFLKRGNKFIDMAFEEEDAAHFNSGYRFFTKVSILTITSYCIAIINITGRILLN